MNKLRWGFLSTANIGRKNWQAIYDSGNSVVAAVASRDIKRSRKFIKECQAVAGFKTSPEAYGRYEELIESPDIDVVYIPLPTGLRKEWVLRAARAGKHVLCEKPCGVSSADVREMIEACRRNRVQFMDGVMFMHNPRMNRIRKALDDGKSIGPMKRITSNFSFHMADDSFNTNVRINSRLEPAGCLGDLGWYCIRFALWTMNWRLPREVTARILSQRNAGRGFASVPADFSAELFFDNGVSAAFYCSFIAEYQNWIHVSGSKGQLRVCDFVHPLSDHEPAFELNNDDVRVKCCNCRGRHSQSREMVQKTNMIRNFSNQARSGKLNKDWPMWALKTQQVMDACLKSARKGSCLKVRA